MNKKLFILVLSALTVALILAIAVGKSVTSRNSAKSATVEVMVAARKLEDGMVLTEKDVIWKSFPETSVYQGVFVKPKDGKDADIKAYNKTVLRDINMGEPITRQALLMDVDGEGAGLAAKLAPGMRAVGIDVKASTVAGGFIAPGDFVDVILTYQMRLTGDSAKYSDVKMSSETVLKHSRVLAIDQSAKDKNFQPKVPKTITLEVDATGAQILNIAGRLGTISLALRRTGEVDAKGAKEIMPTTDVNSSQVLKILKGKMRHHNANGNPTVRVYSGGEAIDMPLNNDVGSDNE